MHTGAELDLMVVRGRERFGLEFQRTSSPEMTPAIRSALADLNLDRMTLVHTGLKAFPISDNVEVVAAFDFLEHLERSPPHGSGSGENQNLGWCAL